MSRYALLIATLCTAACFDPDASGEMNASESSDGGGVSSSGNSTTGASTGSVTVGSSDSSAPETTTSSDDTTDNGVDDSTGDTPPPASSCDATWHPWLVSPFEYPDGLVVGTTDVPGGPWGTVQGAAQIENEHLTTIGTTRLVSSHGEPISFSGSRLRFAVVFDGTNNTVDVGLDADADGMGGLSVHLNAADGAVVLSDNGSDIGSELLGALELGVDYFIEVEVDAGVATLWVSTNNYPTVPGSTLITTIDSIANGAPAGRWASVELADGGGGAPRIDHIEISRCDEIQRGYQDVFFDSFNRPNSESLGSAVYPATSAWDEHNGPELSSIFSNRLRSEGLDLRNSAPAAVAVGVNQSRLTAIVELGDLESSATVIWGFEGPYNFRGPPLLGTAIGNGGGRAQMSLAGNTIDSISTGPLIPGMEYFVSVAVDGEYGVATVRSDSFTGPIVAAVQSNEIAPPPEGLDGVGAAAGGPASYIDDLRLSWYPN